ncbi:TM2 domain-containing protein [Hymenobacter sp. HSC-4F20]|uniref:TM2 domain-containing protein n=1 Tax=Hymenobacter sp. HSC-4F20 TaxID=2864135 RepID=UPI002175CB69|nr:TM2 domain-containing protein [Hymenobacter sp. HSC-4F20]
MTAAPATEELTASVAEVPAVTPVAAAKATHTYAAYTKKHSASTTTTKTVTPTASEVKEAKATIKAMHKASKKARAAAPNDEGKSQIVAALLCFFLGGLGVHDFYLGYIGKGILQIFLSIILIGFILVIIDLVRILTGSLKPKNGDYTKKI